MWIGGISNSVLNIDIFRRCSYKYRQGKLPPVETIHSKN